MMLHVGETRPEQTRMGADSHYVDEARNGAPPAHFVTYRLASLNGKLSAQASAILGKHTNLSLVQLRALAQLRRHGGTAISSDLATDLGMDRGLLSRTLKGLMEMGYVVAETDAVDRRRQYMTITEAGREEHRRVVPVMYQRHEHLLHNVPEEEKDVFYAVLQKLEENSARRDFDLDTDPKP